VLLARAILAAALLAVAACRPEVPSPTAPSTTLTPTIWSTTAVNIRLTVQERVVNATLNDSAAARDFASLLPLTLKLSDFHGSERIAGLPRRLSTSGAAASADPGDLAFYAQWGNLAIYYRDAPPASGVVLLGRLADGGAEVLATAGRVTIELAR
jgi:hypothetical protein